MTKYQIQQIKLNEFRRNSFDACNIEFSIIEEHEDYSAALENWNSYYSGLNDYKDICDNQNLSTAYFYRIVAIYE